MFMFDMRAEIFFRPGKGGSSISVLVIPSLLPHLNLATRQVIFNIMQYHTYIYWMPRKPTFILNIMNTTKIHVYSFPPYPEKTICAWFQVWRETIETAKKGNLHNFLRKLLVEVKFARKSSSARRKMEGNPDLQSCELALCCSSLISRQIWILIIRLSILQPPL